MITGSSLELPPELAHLRTLALDLRWSWSHVADALWEHVDPILWRRTRNPWLILQTVGTGRLRQLAADPRFRALIEELEQEREAAHGTRAWFAQTHAGARLRRVAYFSMEYGLTEGLPLYSGGLGVLAGDHLKTASELGVPLVAVGLLYQQGYFRQGLDPSGAQLAFFPFNDPTQLPVQPLRDADGEWLHVAVPLPGRALWLRTWQVQVGRVRLCPLDSNSPLNSPPDRGITSELYGGGPELRLQQEMVLGIGGYRLLEALDLVPDVCHLNEGHSAFVVLERARRFMQAHDLPFRVALTATRAGNLFTTHTPVAAGFDRFAPDLFAHYMGPYAAELGLSMDALLALGRARPEDSSEPFQMAWLALHGAGAVNGVSRLHGAVSRGLFQPLFPRWPTPEVPVGHVTNGVHVPSWDSPAADRLWTKACGKSRWREATGTMEASIRALDDRTLWELRTANRRRLVDWARMRLVCQSRQWGPSIPAPETALDPDALTLGFARRFATYKRPDLLLHDPERLERLLRDPHRPVQLL
ncbi:MAG TPA: alpha-glucan family phosphorylase, partial [Chromatiales bacterium]|nr:alpha-glucan family phosphorylase [Chromatiales bacterium]